MTDSPTQPKTDEMFCHAVYTSWHVINRAYKRHLGPLGLTYPQYITLTLLWQRDRRNVSELANALSMETSTLTPLLKRLEADGLVDRTRSKEDERQVVVSLTGAGSALRSVAHEITACMIADTGLDEPDLDRLLNTLEKLKAGLSQAGS